MRSVGCFIILFLDTNWKSNISSSSLSRSISFFFFFHSSDLELPVNSISGKLILHNAFKVTWNSVSSLQVSFIFITLATFLMTFACLYRDNIDRNMTDLGSYSCDLQPAIIITFLKKAVIELSCNC